MRNLTICRTKSFVGSMGAMKVYIEDGFHQELTINGIPCRKLGELKNGEEKTFSVGTGAAKVFVIADKLSRNQFNDYYPLPAGEEDVRLTGKNQFHPGAGNPFRFDGVTDEAVLANRKKGNRSGIVVIVVAVLLGLVLGLMGPISSRMANNEPKTFTADGLTITLTAAFEPQEYEGFTQCYEGSGTAVMALKEEFSLISGFGDYSLEEYGLLVIESNGLEDTALKLNENVTYFTYTTDLGDGDVYFYMAAVYKGSDAFWLIQFAAPAAQQEKYESQFLEWASSVVVE